MSSLSSSAAKASECSGGWRVEGGGWREKDPMGIKLSSHGFVGLKGRFCQPRPQAWEADAQIASAPLGAVRRLVDLEERALQPRTWFSPTYPGLPPGLTERSLQDRIP